MWFFTINISVTQILLLIFFLQVLYILLVPITVSFKMDSSFSRDIRIKFFPFNFKIDKQKKKVKEEKKEKKKKSGKIDFAKFISRELQTIKQVFTPFCKFVKSLFISKHHYLNISMEGGLGAPDVTGIAYGVIESVRPVFGNRVIIEYSPDFMTQSVRGSVYAESVVRVYSILAEALILFVRLPLIKIFKILKKIIKGEYNAGKT